MDGDMAGFPLPEDPLGSYPDALPPGIYRDLPEEQYHPLKGFTYSRAKRFQEAPIKAHLPFKETATLRFGTLIHLALTQPHLIEKRFHPVRLKRFNENDTAYKAAVARAGGKELVKLEDLEAALRIRDAVHAQPIGRDLLADGAEAEVSFVWEDPATKLLCRGRTDLWRPSWRAMTDVKSCENASRDKFRETIGQYFYDWQVAHYMPGWELAGGGNVDAFFFLAVEKEAPHLCQAFQLEPQVIARATDELRDVMEAYAACEAAGHWPGYPDEPVWLNDSPRVRYRSERLAAQVQATRETLAARLASLAVPA